MAQGMKLASKGKHEVALGHGGTTAHGKKTGSQSQRHYRDTGESEARGTGAFQGQSFIQLGGGKDHQCVRLAQGIPQWFFQTKINSFI